jgi:hypothetical protein
MANIKRANTSGITKSGVAIPDVPDAPTIGAATDVGTSRAFNNGSATVAFTAAATGGTSATFTATSTPGGFTATGAGSPLTVTGLQSATSYTFAVTGTNASATGAASAASSSITATTVPQAPTVGTATLASGQSYTGSASISVPFTANATGGKAISSYTVTSSSGASNTGASSPISVSETVGNPTSTARTYTVTASNANGASTASSASNSIAAASVPQAPTIGTFTDGGTGTSGTLSFTLNASGGSAITNVTYSTDGTNYTSAGTTTSPITISGLTAGSYTFYVKAVNAQGTSVASSGVAGTVIVPTAFDSIATLSGSGVQTVTFSSIPQGYKSLQIRVLGKSGGANNDELNVRFNAATSGYRDHYLRGQGANGLSVGTDATTSFYNVLRLTGTSNAPGIFTGAIIDVIDYSSTTKTKVLRSFDGFNPGGGTAGFRVGAMSGLFNNTAAITSITLLSATPTNFAAGTTFALYGIK